MTAAMFELGQLVATPGALAALTAAGVAPEQLLVRHMHCDWGDLDDEDRAANAAALIDGSRLFSAYLLPDGEKLWVITEAVGDDGHRASTCILRADEY